MHWQGLILLHPVVKEKMHLQDNTLFDLDLRVKVIQNVAQCPPHHVTNAFTKFEVTTSSMKYIMKTQDYDCDSYFVITSESMKVLISQGRFMVLGLILQFDIR